MWLTESRDDRMTSIISPNIRARAALTVGEGSIIDDYCYFSTRVIVGRGSHIANNCTIAGGSLYLFTLGDYSSVSAGVRIWCSSNDFVNDLIAIGVEDDPTICGDVALGDYSGVGANAVVMPDNDIPEGVAIGALSFVPASYAFAPWTVYAGVPIRPIKARNRERVLRQASRLRPS